MHTHSYNSADCDTDHALVCCKIMMQPKKFHLTKTKGIPRIDVSKMSQPDLMEQFAQTFEKELGSLQPGDSATENWEALRDTMYVTALATFGKKSSKSHDWFEAKSTVMTPVVEAKRAALAEYKHTPSERNLQIFRITRSKAQQTARRCANEHWTELSESIQSATITRNIKGMYDGIKKALGPTLNKTAPLRSSTREVITDRGHQLERWMEHYSDLYSRENSVSPFALDAVECLLTMEELDTEPTLEVLSKAIDSMASGKAPWQQRDPPRPTKALQDHLTAFSACTPLSVLGRRSCTTRHAGRQDHHTLQEQGREEQLQQLQRHLPSKSHW